MPMATCARAGVRDLFPFAVNTKTNGLDQLWPTARMIGRAPTDWSRLMPQPNGRSAAPIQVVAAGPTTHSGRAKRG